MAYEQKDLNGALFKNKDKTEKNPKWADYQGTALVGGVHYYISAWLKTDKNGGKYMSLAFKLAEQRGQPTSRNPARASDDIPFAPAGKGIGGHAS